MSQNQNGSEYVNKYTLIAGESNAQGEMPVNLIVDRVIEIATEHANALGIGYAALIKYNIGWVLSRLSIEMYRYPKINEEYTLSTWIESYNRRFSERNFKMTDADGVVIGYMRTVWVAINFATRTGADLTAVEREVYPVADLPCPISKTPRLSRLSREDNVELYTFKYCDIDFNRHVNTLRYVDLLLNHWSLPHYDRNKIERLDLLFHRECYFGDNVELRVKDTDNISNCEVCRDTDKDAAGIAAVSARITWNKRN